MHGNPDLFWNYQPTLFKVEISSRGIITQEGCKKEGVFQSWEWVVTSGASLEGTGKDCGTRRDVLREASGQRRRFHGSLQGVGRRKAMFKGYRNVYVHLKKLREERASEYG